MSSSEKNRLNDLSPKEWTQYSASVLKLGSKKDLMKHILEVYSKKGDRVGYLKYGRSITWSEQQLASRYISSEISIEGQFNLMILNLEEANNLERFLKSEKWLNTNIVRFLQKLEDERYFLILTKNFRDRKKNIAYFPSHYFITHGLRAHNLVLTDFWIWERSLGNKNNQGQKRTKEPTFLLTFKKVQFSPNQEALPNHEVLISDNLQTSIQRPNRIIEGFSSVREPEYIKHGATFPQKIIEYIIDIYTKEHNIVLDIFGGVGLSLFAANKLNRNAIGIELNPKYIEWAKQVRRRKTGGLDSFIGVQSKNTVTFKMINADNRNILNYLTLNSIDLMVTSPPYFNILHKVAKEAEDRGAGSIFRRRKENINKKSEVLDSFWDSPSISQEKYKTNVAEQILSSSLIPHPYSGDENDFGNITEYEEFLNCIEDLHYRVLQVLKPGAYAIWIVRDFRDMKNKKPYVFFHADLALRAIKRGFIFDDLIVWKQNRERRLIHLGGGISYYNSITHSFIIVLKKPMKES